MTSTLPRGGAKTYDQAVQEIVIAEQDTVAPPRVAIAPLDAGMMAAAQARQHRLTKPPGSLGRLEELSVWLAGVRAMERPRVRRPALVIAAADHGVTRRGVSAYPAEVTGQMVGNFLAGGAAANVLARQAGVRVLVVDAGVATAVPDHPDLIRRPHGPGTADLSTGPAMSRVDARHCLDTGITLAREAAAGGTDALLTGDMGIGNTTAAAAITAVYTGLPAAAVTGRGTGVDQDAYKQKIATVAAALALHQPEPSDPLGVLSTVGGFEIGVLAGVILGGAEARLPVILDGFITGAAALLAAAIQPEVRAYLLAAHRSVEPGHHVALERLGLSPLLDLSMRLGEGSGALLAVQILGSAAALLDEMATFDEAGVSDATPDTEPAG